MHFLMKDFVFDFFHEQSFFQIPDALRIMCIMKMYQGGITSGSDNHAWDGTQDSR